MDNVPIPDETVGEHLDSASEKQRVFHREAAMIAEADAEIAARLWIDAADIDAWIDSIAATTNCPQRTLGADPAAQCRGR
jgi:hypothetical protein